MQTDLLPKVQVMTEEVARNIADQLNASPAHFAWRYEVLHQPKVDGWVVLVYDENNYYVGAL